MVPRRSDGGQRGYLLPSDGDPDRAELTGYPLEVLYGNLGKLEEARTVVVYLDAGFSGDSHAGMLVQAESAVAYRGVEPPANVTVLAAASGAEAASWDEETRHGLFTNHLLDALYGGGDADGDGQVTAGEAHEYLSRHVTREARRAYRRRQTPTLTGPAATVVARAVAGAFPRRPALTTAAAATEQAAEPAAQDGEPRAAMRPGSTFRDCEECPELVVVPAGSFLMGSPPSEDGREKDEGPRRRVTIAAPFAVGAYEVTRRQYERYVTATGSATDVVCRVDGRRMSGVSWRAPGFRQTDAEPVVCVNWEEAQAYVSWLSRRTGQEYRLLSEAEWEYVARGGADTTRHWGEGGEQCRYANGADATAKRRHRGWTVALCDDRHYRTAPAGSYLPNAYGVHDVLGNVREWTADCGNADYQGAPVDGSAWEQGDCGYRAVRGGAWHSAPDFLRSADRSWGPPGNRSNRLGFRVARTL